MDATEGDDVLMTKAFCVYEDISGYNPANCPTNGFEYLHQVITENSKLPKTMVAEVDFEKFKTNQTFYVNEIKRSSLRVDLLPSQEWQQVQVRYFADLREKVNHMRELWGSTKLSSNNTVSIPSDISDEDSWLHFCAESPPLLQILFSIQQPGIMKLLNYFSSWLSDSRIEFTDNSTQWIYAIFASLEEPLWPSTFADLRDVLRLAREKRATIENSNDNLLNPLNMIICVGARHFRQTDLCD